LADHSTLNPLVIPFIEKAEGRLWSAEESAHSLEQARNAAVPSRLEEDWRKTDADAFPWDKLEDVDPARTKREVSVRSLGENDASGLIPLEADGGDAARQLHLIAGDDYDAKFLYYHKALSSSPVCFRMIKGFHGDPIEIVQRASGPGLATFTTIIIVEAGSKVTLYDRWEAGEESSAAIGRTEIIVEDGAHLTYLQEDEMGARTPLYRRGRVQMGRDTKLQWFAATPGANWHAARLEIDLNGPGSEAVFKGLFTGAGEAHADHRTHQHHAAPSCKSDLLFKTLLSGHARSVYQGLISVPQEAQKTDAYQQCRNLLLEPGTHADAIPKLEIIADDVRCTHGASMGSLNKEQMFYLQSRGLPPQQAMIALASGFAEQVITNVPVESIRERWRGLVTRVIGGVK
jgi:Fe-S cluster assembly protein SufD